jgi:uncharacterized protein (DUF433 family)
MSEIITSDPKICHGKPTIRGTRIMVANILSLHIGGYTDTQITNYYPELKEEDVKATLEYANALIPGDKKNDA